MPVVRRSNSTSAGSMPVRSCSGVRAAEPPEPRIGGGRRVDRQQVQDAAAERPENVRQRPSGPELAGRRDDGVVPIIQGPGYTGDTLRG